MTSPRRLALGNVLRRSGRRTHEPYSGPAGFIAWRQLSLGERGCAPGRGAAVAILGWPATAVRSQSLRRLARGLLGIPHGDGFNVSKLLFGALKVFLGRPVLMCRPRTVMDGLKSVRSVP